MGGLGALRLHAAQTRGVQAKCAPRPPPRILSRIFSGPGSSAWKPRIHIHWASALKYQLRGGSFRKIAEPPELKETGAATAGGPPELKGLRAGPAGGGSGRAGAGAAGGTGGAERAGNPELKETGAATAKGPPELKGLHAGPAGGGSGRAGAGAAGGTGGAERAGIFCCSAAGKVRFPARRRSARGGAQTKSSIFTNSTYFTNSIDFHIFSSIS